MIRDPSPAAMAAAPADAPRSPHRSATALALLLLGVAVFFAPALTGAGQFLRGDTGRMHIAMKRWIAMELARGHVPEWNPFAGLGAPVTAGAIDAVFHPFNALLVALPFDAGFRCWVVASYLLAALGAFLWARALGCGPHAAAAAGAAFSLSGFLVCSSENLTFLTALATLPLVFAAAHRFVARPGPGRAALVGLAGALAASAGDPQSFLMALALLPAYAAAVIGREDAEGAGPLRRAARALAAVALALLLAAPFLLPVAAWIPHSSRGEALDPLELERWNLHPLRVFELAVPHLVRGEPGALHSEPYIAYAGDRWTVLPWVGSVYIGITTLALALAGAVRSAAARALVAAAAVATWAAMGPNAGFGQLVAPLPVIGAFRYWEKLAIWPALLLAVAAAIGIEAVSRARSVRFPGALAGLAALLLGAGAALAVAPAAAAAFIDAPAHPLAATLLVRNLRAGLLHAGLLALALAGATWLVTTHRIARAAPAVLALLVGIDVAASSTSDWSLSPNALAKARAPLGEALATFTGMQRVVTPAFDVSARWDGLTAHESASLWFARSLHATFNVDYRVGNFRNYLALVPARAMRYERRAGVERLLAHVGLWNVAHAVIPIARDRAGAFGLPPPYSVEAEDPLLPAFLLALPHRPRTYVASELVEVDRRRAMEFALSEDPRSPRSVVEGALPVGYVPAIGAARVVRDEPERVEVVAEANREALLVLNDVFAAGWTAEVDGQGVPIIPVNYLARGVWIGRGEHRVIFRYRTPLLREGWLVAITALAAVVLWAGGLRWRRRSRERT